MFGSCQKTWGMLHRAQYHLMSCSTVREMLPQVWALGCVLYSLLVGKLPFDGEDKAEQVYSILNKQLKFPSRIKSDPDLVDLLTRMLDRNPRRRITVDEALRHPWVSYCLLYEIMPDGISVILTCVRVWSCRFDCIRRSRLSVQENQCAQASCDR